MVSKLFMRLFFDTFYRLFEKLMCLKVTDLNVYFLVFLNCLCVWFLEKFKRLVPRWYI